jgi:hypothetical protein
VDRIGFSGFDSISGEHHMFEGPPRSLFSRMRIRRMLLRLVSLLRDANRSARCLMTTTVLLVRYPPPRLWGVMTPSWMVIRILRRPMVIGITPGVRL